MLYEEHLLADSLCTTGLPPIRAMHLSLSPPSLFLSLSHTHTRTHTRTHTHTHTHNKTWGGWTHSFLSFLFLVRFLPVCSLPTTLSNGHLLFSDVSITTVSGYSKHTQRISPQRMLATHLLVRDKLFSSAADKLALLV